MVWFASRGWLNPAGDRRAGFDVTCALLSAAKRFHQDIEHTYHPLSYAHYGADPNRPSWETVSWIYELPILAAGWQNLHIQSDSGQGLLTLTESKAFDDLASGITVKLGPAAGAGDQTVPTRSSDHQLRSGKFKGIFRQTGYEHQASYGDSRALHATLYSIAKIASTMKWNE